MVGGAHITVLWGQMWLQTHELWRSMNLWRSLVLQIKHPVCVPLWEEPESLLMLWLQIQEARQQFGNSLWKRWRNKVIRSFWLWRLKQKESDMERPKCCIATNQKQKAKRMSTWQYVLHFYLSKVKHFSATHTHVCDSEACWDSRRADASFSRCCSWE